MRVRRRIIQRLPAWFAFLAIGLAVCAPTVSQCVLAQRAAMATSHDAMGGMSADCPGHTTMAMPAASPDPAARHGRGGAPMESCGYCHLMAHPPVLASVPPLPMRVPATVADIHPPPVPMRPLVGPWLFDAAPRGPPPLT